MTSSSTNRTATGQELERGISETVNGYIGKDSSSGDNKIDNNNSASEIMTFEVLQKSSFDKEIKMEHHLHEDDAVAVSNKRKRTNNEVDSSYFCSDEKWARAGIEPTPVRSTTIVNEPVGTMAFAEIEPREDFISTSAAEAATVPYSQHLPLGRLAQNLAHQSVSPSPLQSEPELSQPAAHTDSPGDPSGTLANSNILVPAQLIQQTNAVLHQVAISLDKLSQNIGTQNALLSALYQNQVSPFLGGLTSSTTNPNETSNAPSVDVNVSLPQLADINIESYGVKYSTLIALDLEPEVETRSKFFMRLLHLVFDTTEICNNATIGQSKTKNRLDIHKVNWAKKVTFHFRKLAAGESIVKVWGKVQNIVNTTLYEYSRKPQPLQG